MFLHRPSFYSKDAMEEEARKTAEVHIGKQRNGPTGQDRGGVPLAVRPLRKPGRPAIVNSSRSDLPFGVRPRRRIMAPCACMS